MYTIDQTYLQAAAGMQAEEGLELPILSGGVLGYNLITLVDTNSNNPDSNRVSARSLPSLLSIQAELEYPNDDCGGTVLLFRNHEGIIIPLSDALCSSGDKIELREFGDSRNGIVPDTTDCTVQPLLTNWLIRKSGLEIPSGIVAVTRPMSYYTENPSIVTNRKVPPFHIIFGSTARKLDPRRLRPTFIIDGEPSELPFTEPDVLLGGVLVRNDGFKIRLDIRSRGTVRCPVTGLEPTTGETLADGAITKWQTPRKLAIERGRKGVEVGVYGTPDFTLLGTNGTNLNRGDTFELQTVER